MVKFIGWLNAIFGVVVLIALSGITGWRVESSASSVSGARVFLFILAMFLLFSGMALVSSTLALRSRERM